MCFVAMTDDIYGLPKADKVAELIFYGMLQEMDESNLSTFARGESGSQLKVRTESSKADNSFELSKAESSVSSETKNSSVQDVKVREWNCNAI